MTPSQATVQLHALFTTSALRSPPADLSEAIERFLDAGADLNYPTLDAQGEAAYPLVLAASESRVDWVKFLLDLGARVDVEPLHEDMADDAQAPVSPFAPLGRVVNALEFLLERDDPCLPQAVETLDLILAAGAMPNDADAFVLVSPLDEWFREAGCRLPEDEPLSPSQLAAVLRVTDALLEKLPGDLQNGFRQAVYAGGGVPAYPQADDLLAWPEGAKMAWVSRSRAHALESLLLPSTASLRPIRM